MTIKNNINKENVMRNSMKKVFVLLILLFNFNLILATEIVTSSHGHRAVLHINMNKKITREELKQLLEPLRDKQVIQFIGIILPSNMSKMFKNFQRLRLIIIEGEAFKDVTNMSKMFEGAIVFDQDISGWNVRKVKYMSSMFHNASAFNNGGKPLTWGDKVTKVEFIDFMFSGAKKFNQDIRNWNTINAYNRGHIFLDADSYSGGQPKAPRPINHAVVYLGGGGHL